MSKLPRRTGNIIRNNNNNNNSNNNNNKIGTETLHGENGIGIPVPLTTSTLIVHRGDTLGQRIVSVAAS